jgi:hypothetical protein
MNHRSIVGPGGAEVKRERAEEPGPPGGRRVRL